MPPPIPMADAAVLELRQYTLRPGARDDLVTLFERELIEPQEAAGMTVGGVFLDRDDADRFVWFRGFADSAARRRALETFYHGPVWEQHREAANATMLDSDDVLLLRPTEPARPAPDPATPRPDVESTAPSEEWVTVSTYVHDPDPALTSWLTNDVHAEIERELGVPVAAYRTEPAENDFPALPVRPDHAFVWMAAFPDRRTYDDACRRLEESRTWRQDVEPRLRTRLTGRRVLRLQPTARSQHPASGAAASRFFLERSDEAGRRGLRTADRGTAQT